MIKFNKNEEKITSSILWIAVGRDEDKVKTLNILSLAEVMHISRYGRPITGGLINDYKVIDKELF